jgi:hypothetical protein
MGAIRRKTVLGTLVAALSLTVTMLATPFANGATASFTMSPAEVQSGDTVTATLVLPSGATASSVTSKGLTAPITLKLSNAATNTYTGAGTVVEATGDYAASVAYTVTGEKPVTLTATFAVIAKRQSTTTPTTTTKPVTPTTPRTSTPAPSTTRQVPRVPSGPVQTGDGSLATEF